MSVKKSSTYYFQDSIPVFHADSVVHDTTDNSGNSKQFSAEEVYSIFETLERREKELDSLTGVRSRERTVRPPASPAPIPFDTASVPYRESPEQGALKDNPLSAVKWKMLYPKESSIFIEEAPPSAQQVQPFEKSRDHSYVSGHEPRPDWLLGLILFCLVLIAWLKLFYNKFLNQTMQSLLNFQLSAKLFRDQNMFSRRVAIALNLNFVLTGGAFIYLIFEYFQIHPFDYTDHVSFLFYSGIVAGLLFLRFFVSHTVGYVFQKQIEFQEYQHQILLIYKNLGIYLIPLVFAIAYIHEDIRVYLIYLGILMLFTSFILRLFRGFKLLMKKDVLIFYLILYLCTLEILPLLILYRFFSSLVLTG